MDIDIDRSFDSAASALPHAAPVLKTVTVEMVSGNRGYGFIPILYFDIIQVNFNDISVSIKFRHFNPISDPDRIICRELNTGHQSQNCVLKYQKKNGCHRTKSTQKRSEEHTSELRSRGHI